MKKLCKGIAISILAICLSGNIVNAEGWLKTGMDIFNSVNNNSSSSQGTSGFTTGEVASAFKEALGIGTQHVVGQLGATDGFNSDPAIHIPLPEKLQSVKKILDKIGMSYMVDDLELKLNRAAEQATPMARELFLQAISEMTFEDVMSIYNGPKDSATRYFQSKMTPSLQSSMRPIVDDAMSEVGAVQSYDAVIGKYRSVPFVPDVKANLTDHVLEKGIEGIFYYVAKEEEAIRTNPLKQTTSLLKKVFGRR
ncbi:MAG: hypothetical protein CSA81_02915 [Acidobacteria bacterium]|nr:MAG: hypothetical protein CSA81_02915 [Acidobacteriota bacterium]